MESWTLSLNEVDDGPGDGVGRFEGEEMAAVRDHLEGRTGDLPGRLVGVAAEAGHLVLADYQRGGDRDLGQPAGHGPVAIDLVASGGEELGARERGDDGADGLADPGFGE